MKINLAAANLKTWVCNMNLKKNVIKLNQSDWTREKQLNKFTVNIKIALYECCKTTYEYTNLIIN